jgi:hypothetical protein
MRHFEIYIDSNSINARGEILAVNQIYNWEEQSKVSVISSEAGMDEQPKGNIQSQELNKHFFSAQK